MKFLFGAVLSDILNNFESMFKKIFFFHIKKCNRDLKYTLMNRKIKRFSQGQQLLTCKAIEMKNSIAYFTPCNATFNIYYIFYLLVFHTLWKVEKYCEQ